MSDRDNTEPDPAEHADARAADESADIDAEIGADVEVANPELAESGEPSDGGSADFEVASAAPDDGLTPRERRRLRQEQARRRKRDRFVWIGMIAAGIVMLVGFLYLFWPVMAGRLNAVKQVDQAQALLERAKPNVDSIDKLVTAQLSASAAPGVPDTAPQILVTRRDLKQALALIDQAMPHLTEDEQTHATSVRAAAQARLDMLAHAPTILVASVKAVQAKTFVDRASAETSAATLAESAASHNFTLATASKVESASVALQRIRGQLGDARQLYAQAVAAFPGVGLERFTAYLDMRIQAAKLFSAATSVWLSGNKAGGSAQFAAYQQQLAKAAASVASPPSAPAAPGQAFRKVAGSAADAYKNAKKQAADADKALSTP
ncbi:MAG: hypothetical protein P4L93_12325 [Coriobacteriia bacterium]|nr:hypothetical protein [Coriobacteriia bacterium]